PAESHGGDWDGAVSLAEQDSVQGLPAIYETGERAVEERVPETVPRAGIAGRISARPLGTERRTGGGSGGREEYRQRSGMRHQRGGAESDVRTPRHAHHPANTSLRRPVPVSDPSRSGLDVRAHPDLVSLQYPDRAEWAGMAGPANGHGEVAIPATGELLCLDGGLGASPEFAGAAIGDQLGRTAERFRQPVASGSRTHLRTVPVQLLLDRVSVGVGQRHHVSRGGVFEAAEGAAGGA